MALRAPAFTSNCVAATRSSRRTAVIVRADGKINPNIRKNEEKVVDMVKASELKKPKCVVCRCWKAKTFPYCDGAHVQHNKDTGDNVGPFVIDTAN